MSLGLSLDPLMSNNVEASRISDVDRDLKSLREKMSKFGQNIDGYLQEIRQGETGQRHNFDEAKLDENRLGRGLPRTMPGEVSDGFQERSVAWEAKFARCDEVKLLTFNGSSHKVDFLDWIDTLEDYFQAVNPPDAVKCKLATSKLKGEARTWWNELQNTRFSEGKNLITSWSRMSDILHDRFLNTSRLTWWYEPENETSVKPVTCSTKVHNQLNNNECEAETIEYLQVVETMPSNCSMKLPKNEKVEEAEKNDVPVLQEEQDWKEKEVKHTRADVCMPTKCSTEVLYKLHISNFDEVKDLGSGSNVPEYLGFIDEFDNGRGMEQTLGSEVDSENVKEHEEEVTEAKGDADNVHTESDHKISGQLSIGDIVSRVPTCVGFGKDQLFHRVLDILFCVFGGVDWETYGFCALVSRFNLKMFCEVVLVNSDPGGKRQCGLRMSGQIQDLLHLELLQYPRISVISKGGTELKIEENSLAYDFDTNKLIKRATSKYGLDKTIMEEYDWRQMAQRCKLVAVIAVRDEMDRFWVSLHWLIAMVVVLFDPGGPYKDKLHWFRQHTCLLHNMSLNKGNMNRVKVKRTGPVALKALHERPWPKLNANSNFSVSNTYSICRDGFNEEGHDCAGYQSLCDEDESDLKSTPGFKVCIAVNFWLQQGVSRSHMLHSLVGDDTTTVLMLSGPWMDMKLSSMPERGIDNLTETFVRLYNLELDMEVSTLKRDSERVIWPCLYVAKPIFRFVPTGVDAYLTPFIKEYLYGIAISLYHSARDLGNGNDNLLTILFGPIFIDAPTILFGDMTFVSNDLSVHMVYSADLKQATLVSSIRLKTGENLREKLGVHFEEFTKLCDAIESEHALRRKDMNLEGYQLGKYAELLRNTSKFQLFHGHWGRDFYLTRRRVLSWKGWKDEDKSYTFIRARRFIVNDDNVKDEIGGSGSKEVVFGKTTQKYMLKAIYRCYLLAPESKFYADKLIHKKEACTPPCLYAIKLAILILLVRFLSTTHIEAVISYAKLLAYTLELIFQMAGSFESIFVPWYNLPTDMNSEVTRGRVIPWEGWNDRNDENNTSTQDMSIRDEIGVAILSIWLSILSKGGHLRKILRLFFKTVNGLDPPTHMKVKMDSFNMDSFNVARGRAFLNSGME